MPTEAEFFHPRALLLFDKQGTVTCVSRQQYLHQVETRSNKLATAKEFMGAADHFPKAGNLLVHASSRIPTAVAWAIRQAAPNLDADAEPVIVTVTKFLKARPWSLCVACEPDGIAIAAVLNRQDKRTATGEGFTSDRVGNLRRYWKIPVYQPPPVSPQGELLTIQGAADKLGLAASTLHRWLMDGFIPGEQVTPGAPWRIRMTKELQDLFVAEAPEGYVTMPEAMRRLGVSRQTIMQRVKRGELPFVHVRRGRQKGLLLKVATATPPFV